MKNIKGNKNDLIKEYNNFCNDLNLDKKSINSIKRFCISFIEYQVKFYGIFDNKNIKTSDFSEIQREIFNILNKKYIKGEINK